MTDFYHADYITDNHHNNDNTRAINSIDNEMYDQYYTRVRRFQNLEPEKRTSKTKNFSPFFH